MIQFLSFCISDPKMSNDKLLIYDRQKVWDVFGKSEKGVLKDVEIVRNWLKEQAHLPEVTGDDVIEAFLITNKFSIERTKQKLDMYYTIRTLLPQMFENKNPSLPHMQQTFDAVYNVPLPKQTKEMYRVVVLKIMAEPDDFDTDNYLAHQMNIAEVRLHEDVAMGDVYIVDFETLKMGHVVKISPMHLKRAAMVLEKVFSNRVKGIHIINYPSFMDILMRITKTVLKQKLLDRIHYHSAEDLIKYIPKDILPKDYGGDAKPLKELNELWRLKVAEYKDRFDKLDKMRVKEDLRPEPLKNDDLLGYHGNFKKLDVD